MKLAIVTETFPPEVNGVAMTFGIIAQELSRRGHQVTVYRPERRDLPDRETGKQYRVSTLPGFRIPGYPEIKMGFPARSRLEREWRMDRPDFVHVVTEGPLGASAVSAARSLKLPVTSSFHTNFHSYAGHYGCGPLKSLAVSWLRRVHNRTARTFAPTPELCGELGAMGFKRLGVLSRGVDMRSFSPLRRSLKLRGEWRAAADNPVVLHVGRLAPEKNYPLLFRIYAAMRTANPRLRFVLAGEGPLQKSLQREHSECIFAGFFSREEIGRYYASADIYVHASTTETFGNVLTEAMASGLAVAGFDYAAAQQFMRNGENGLTAPTGNEKALSAAAVRLATDHALRLRLRSAAPASLAEQSWAKVIGRFEADLAAIATQDACS
ncbi:MAG: glycosyltransferase family 1 protein [Opitutaceae bacterium]|jgi:glycosyltransferase involved in cell wall biosynthesis